MKGRREEQLGLADGALGMVEGRVREGGFLQRLEQLIDFGLIEQRLGTMYGKTGRRSRDPLVVYKMLLLQHFYNLSDPEVESQVNDRLSFRRFCGLTLSEAAPDETTLVRFRARLREAGLDTGLFDLVNAQLAERGLMVRTTTVVDATLISAATALPTREQTAAAQTRDPDASYTAKRGRAIYGYKAHIGVDGADGLIRTASLTTAREHDTKGLARVVPPHNPGRVIADKGFDSAKNRDHVKAAAGRDGLMRRDRQGRSPKPPSPWHHRRNRLLAAMRGPVEKIFGHWKRTLGYQRVRYLGLEKNTQELIYKCLAWNLRRAMTL